MIVLVEKDPVLGLHRATSSKTNLTCTCMPYSFAVDGY